MSQSWWYVNRAAGIVAWALLAASLVAGLLLSGKALGKRARPNWLLDLHRGLSGLAIAFVGVHVAGAIGDSYIHFGAKEVLVPMTSGWRPLAIAWGVVSGYLLVAVEASSLLRKHIPKQIWKRIHFLSFPLFLSATVHAVTAGTEMGTTVGIAAASLVTAGIGALTVHRIQAARHAPPPRQIPPRPAPRAEPALPAQPVGVGSYF
jgi:hypothetical protein